MTFENERMIEATDDPLQWSVFVSSAMKHLFLLSNCVFSYIPCIL
jgi:hypothetical protein